MPIIAMLRARLLISVHASSTCAIEHRSAVSIENQCIIGGKRNRHIEGRVFVEGFHEASLVTGGRSASAIIFMNSILSIM
jgi:hypothetical protein